MTPYIGIWSLADAIFPLTSRQRWMAMFVAYFDASGTHTGCPVVTVSGFVARADRWKKFQIKWADIIEKAGLEYFHMTDFEAWKKSPIYKDWSQEKRVSVLKRLINAIAEHVTFAASSSVIVPDYEAVRKQVKHLQEVSPFTFCVERNFLEIGRWADKLNMNENIAYIFEAGDKFGNEMDALKRTIEKDEEKRHLFRFGSYITLSKKEANPLQASDLLAFENQKEMLNFHHPQKEVRPPRKSLRRLHNKLVQNDIEIYAGFYNKAIFDKAIAALNFGLHASHIN